jgi:nucleoside-diphosphate-sugar epimerase
MCCPTEAGSGTNVGVKSKSVVRFSVKMMRNDITANVDEKVALVTGANGFVGGHLVDALASRGWRVRRALRAAVAPDDAAVGDINGQTNWDRALQGVNAIVHLASRVHVMRETASDPLAAFREVNVAGTRRLAEAAIHAGVKRFVFVSSIKVNGERTTDRPFDENSPAAPRDAYGQSKLEAEEALRAMRELDVVIVRPPVVYGPGVKGNILRLMKLVDRGVPLPLGRVRNRRSMIGVRNLCDFLVKCAGDSRAAGELFLICDDEALSTCELVRRIGSMLNRQARVWPFPVSAMRAAASLVGAGETIARLTESLEVDSRKAREMLGWSAPMSVDAQLEEMVRWYRMRADDE